MAFTYFFRDLQTLEKAVKQTVPILAGRARAHVWDAGCAMGPEPYSLAILFAEAMGKFAFKNLKIFASDIDGSNLFGKTIADGVYPYEELQRIPRPLFEKYFHETATKGMYQIDDMIRTRVRYQRHDLLSLSPIGDGFGLIACKNVLLHFQQTEREQVVRMFHDSLAPDGLLVLEQTQKLPHGTSHMFEQVSADVQLFRKREAFQ